MTDKIFASYDFDSGTAAARPATPTVSDGRLYIYAATDTDVISVWDGAVWASFKGANTGDQTITLTGDVTGSGTGSFATTIGAGKVTEAMQVLANNTTQDVTSTKHGYAPISPADATKFLNGAATPAYVDPLGAVTGWTVTDQSGASLSLSGVNSVYVKNGNMVTIFVRLQYPVTANNSNAVLSLPFPVPNQSYTASFWFVRSSGASNTLGITASQNTSPGQMTPQLTPTGPQATNANLSGLVMIFSLTYTLV